MLSDIQGFTFMVERFSRLGAAGVEGIALALNGYLADVVEIVHRYGGDVIAIAGDSVLCFWKSCGDLSLEEVTCRAGQAGLAIQSALHDRETAQNLHFQTRIGIGSGPVTLSFVGGFNGRWECLLAGEALTAAVNAERLATAGEVILSPKTAALMDHVSGCECLEQGHRRLLSVTLPTPPPPPVQQKDAETLDQLVPILPRPLLYRLNVPSARWLPEFRLVTLFLATLPSAPDETGLGRNQMEQIHPIIQSFQQVVDEFGGTAKVDLDAKGALLLGVWGLPPQAQEDDALLAVEAARKLHHLTSGGKPISIGMATGRVLTGAFGSRTRSEYIVRGPVINVAARLMAAAKGELLADLATIQATRHRIAYEELPALKVKGMSEPVPVVRPLGKRSRLVTCASAIVGRSMECERLIAALDTLQRQGLGSTWLIEAEAGLGKTLLCQMVAREAHARGASVLIATADAIDGRRTFGAWREVLRSLLGGGDPLSMHEALLERLQSLPELIKLAPLAADILPIELSDSAITQEMTGQVRAEGTRRLMSGLLQEWVRDRPTVVIFEDAHWADSLSCDLLEDIAAAGLPLLLLVTMRPNPSNERSLLAELKSEHVMRLTSLHNDEIDRLVCSELGVRSAPSRLLQWIRDRVAGHPFFTSELVRSLHAAGAVHIREGRCTVGDLDQLSLPFSIEGLITSRINRLSPAEQLTLKVAAVIGHVFGERLLRTTHPAKEVDVGTHCDRFVERELTTLLKKHSNRTYEFRHALMRDVAYAQLSYSQQKMLHRAVAHQIETEHRDKLAAVAALLAQHWERAEDTDRSITYTELAGEHGLRTGAFKEAIIHFEKALAIARQTPELIDPARVAKLQMGLGKAAYFLGDLTESRRWLEQAVEALDQPLPRTARATSLPLVQAVVVQLSHRMLGVRNAVGAGEQKAIFEAICDGYRCLSQIYFLQDEPAIRLAYLTLRGVNLGERASASASLARSLANLGAALSLVGLKTWSSWYGNRAVAMADQEGQYAAGAYVRHINAIRLVGDGQAVEALQSSNEALERIEALGDFNLELEATSVKAMIAATSGNYDEAELAARRCVAISRQTGSLTLGGWAQLNLVDVALARNDLTAAQTSLAEGRAILAGLTDLATRVLMHRAEAMLARHESRWIDALRSSRALIDTVGTTMPTAYYIADAYGVACGILAEGAIRGKDVSRAELNRYTRRLRKLARNYWNLEGHLQFIQDCRRLGLSASMHRLPSQLPN